MLSLGQDMYKTNPKHLTVPNSKDATILGILRCNQLEVLPMAKYGTI